MARSNLAVKRIDAQPVQLLETRTLPVDTHRAELVPLPDGGMIVVVVQPDPTPPGTPQNAPGRAVVITAWPG